MVRGRKIKTVVYQGRRKGSNSKGGYDKLNKFCRKSQWEPRKDHGIPGNIPKRYFGRRGAMKLLGMNSRVNENIGNRHNYTKILLKCLNRWTERWNGSWKKMPKLGDLVLLG